MQSQNREITIKINSRPLRCAYLAHSREDVLDAVTLYTHTWGGTANAIFPAPLNDAELVDLRDILQMMNPDYIFIPSDEKISESLDQILQTLPISRIRITKEDIRNHTEELKLLRLSDGYLSSIEQLLASTYPNLDKINIHLVEEGDSYELELALNIGLPSSRYRKGLTQFFNSTVYSTPKTIEKLLKMTLALSKFHVPTYLTMANTGRSYNFLQEYALEINDEETLCLFLDDGRGTGIASAFWNCRWVHPENKVFLPKFSFFEELENCIALIIKFIPHIRAISITTSISRDEAENLYNCVKTAFLKAGHPICVNVYYKNFQFNWLLGKVYSNKDNIFNRTIASDGCVRFEVATPIGHENAKLQFAYDAEFKVSGKHFFMPGNVIGSKLLTNELWRIENAEEDKQGLGDSWLNRNLLVRANSQGISGVALPGKENHFYIHPDNIVITQLLQGSEIEFKPNKHTRYAQGLIKRLGGIEIVAALLRKGGADIISVLVADRTEHKGLNKGQLLSSLIKKRLHTQQDAKEIIKQKLQPLLENNLLSRGYCLECPACNLKNWFLLEEVREFVECRGCAEKFQLPFDDQKFVYKPNELAVQLVQEGGLAVLLTAVLFRRFSLSSSSYLQFGGDLYHIGSNKNFAEIDLFWLTENGLVISECKSFFINNKDLSKSEKEIEEKLERIRESLGRNIDSAKLLNAKIIILGVHSNLPEIPGLFNVMAPFVEKAHEEGIGLHLVLNDMLYPWGKSMAIEPREVNFKRLLTDEEVSNYEDSFGEVPKNFGGLVGSKGLFDETVLECWDAELKQ